LSSQCGKVTALAASGQKQQAAGPEKGADVPARGAFRLLEIGCGSGVHLRYAAERNSSLTALAVELQPAVAEMARTNLRGWGLESRVKVGTGDIREKAPDEPFDIATLQRFHVGDEYGEPERRVVDAHSALIGNGRRVDPAGLQLP